MTLSCPTLAMLKPDRSTLASTLICGASGFMDLQTLPSAGTYTVFVDTGSQGGNITVAPNDATTVTGTIAINGSSVTETVNPGQDIELTFSGASGQGVTLSAANSTLDCPTVAILKPDGSTLASRLYCGASGSLGSQTLPSTGSYTALVDTSDKAGSVTLNLTSP